MAAQAHVAEPAVRQMSPIPLIGHRRVELDFFRAAGDVGFRAAVVHRPVQFDCTGQRKTTTRRMYVGRWTSKDKQTAIVLVYTNNETLDSVLYNPGVGRLQVRHLSETDAIHG
jgi:hypothetical protein